MAGKQHAVNDEVAAKLAGALTDRNAYSQHALAKAARAYQQLGDVDAAADQVAEQINGPNCRQLAQDDD